MSRILKRQIVAITTVFVLCGISSAWSEEPYVVPLKNPSLSEGVNDSGVPLGWTRYGSGGKAQKLEITQGDGLTSLLIADGDREAEIGVSQAFKLKGDETYQVTAKVRATKGASTSGAYLQLRFLPSN